MSTDPMPRDFGWRYVLWLAYTNALTIIFTTQLIIQQITYDPNVARAPWAHWLITVINILGIIGAQMKKNRPPPPPPLQKAT